MRRIGALVFEGFELLDLFGPLEMFGIHDEDFAPVIIAEGAGPVASAQGPRVAVDARLDAPPPFEILLVPGGRGVRREVGNARLTGWVAEAAKRAEMVLSVCTGAALLARAGVLDGRRATTNKRAFDWVVRQGPKVDWQRRARWVEDGHVITASGVSAGMDMSLAAIGRLLGKEAARDAARQAEYLPHCSPEDDPFARAEPAALRG
ncbi:DJ-1/PfpI family protein [Paralimibaculum aggregatum]|uniref:DJ-1/PfpI family protein n=1 Tax=Paralimibaculum aggregatum TaxID=3036245 RepID=A0ABQ6LFW0_9RHOB|nr:DJ-1/PfpI family protein [Limibaculum sp. NKW23]GMG82215.1 DJ-1/PfpI family protein [Limibaculum sp. NKW23]